MVIVKLQGGLGNQMFQYAAARSLSIKHRCELYLDCNYLGTESLSSENITPRKFELDKFQTEYSIFAIKKRNKLFDRNYLRRIINKLSGNSIHYLIEDSLDLNRDKIKLPVYLDGYWQSEQYFKQYEDQIRREFTFKKELDHRNELILKLIRDTLSVSIHIRRGDYVTSPQINRVHGVCSFDYYIKSINLMKEKYPGAHLFIFSDDPLWAQNEFKPAFSNAIVVSNENETESWKDLKLMSNCKHHIIANSSFSWWGAWLNANIDKTVIAPRNWFNDPDKNIKSVEIIPNTWIRL